MSETVPKILHVLETCIYGHDLVAMERFYAGILGLSKMSEEYPRHIFFRISDHSVLLIFNPIETMKVTEIPSHGADGPGHVAFAVDREERLAWIDRLNEQGVEIEREIVWPNDAKSVYFRDPAGNSVELVTSDIWES